MYTMSLRKSACLLGALILSLVMGASARAEEQPAVPATVTISIHMEITLPAEPKPQDATGKPDSASAAPATEDATLRAEPEKSNSDD